MNCPACKNHDCFDTVLHSDSNSQDIYSCRACGTSWSVSHGLLEIIGDPQVSSFLETQSECVEGDDYNTTGGKKPSR